MNSSLSSNSSTSSASFTRPQLSFVPQSPRLDMYERQQPQDFGSPPPPPQRRAATEISQDTDGWLEIPNDPLLFLPSLSGDDDEEVYHSSASAGNQTCFSNNEDGILLAPRLTRDSNLRNLMAMNFLDDDDEDGDDSRIDEAPSALFLGEDSFSNSEASSTSSSMEDLDSVLLLLPTIEDKHVAAVTTTTTTLLWEGHARNEQGNRLSQWGR